MLLGFAKFLTVPCEVIKEENLSHHFMSVGATKKSLHSYIACFLLVQKFKVTQP